MRRRCPAIHAAIKPARAPASSGGRLLPCRPRCCAGRRLADLDARHRAVRCARSASSGGTYSGVWRSWLIDDHPICSSGNRSRRVVFTNAGWSSSVARWAHNPEVVGSNPTPATSGNGPRDTVPGTVFIGSVTSFVTRRAFLRLGGQLQRFANELGDQFGGFPVMACRPMPVDLKGHTHVGVADPITDDLRCDAAVQRERGVGVPDV